MPNSQGDFMQHTVVTRSRLSTAVTIAILRQITAHSLREIPDVNRGLVDGNNF